MKFANDERDGELTRELRRARWPIIIDADDEFSPRSHNGITFGSASCARGNVPWWARIYPHAWESEREASRRNRWESGLWRTFCFPFSRSFSPRREKRPEIISIGSLSLSLHWWTKESEGKKKRKWNLRFRVSRRVPQWRLASLSSTRIYTPIMTTYSLRPLRSYVNAEAPLRPGCTHARLVVVGESSSVLWCRTHVHVYARYNGFDAFVAYISVVSCSPFFLKSKCKLSHSIRDILQSAKFEKSKMVVPQVSC